MASNKYFAILDGDKTLFVEITPERAEIIAHQYEGDEAWYMADILSEEFGFSINNVQWSVIASDKIQCIGKPLHAVPSKVYYIQHHTYDQYEGPCGKDGITGAFSTYEEALQFIKEWDYEDLYGEVCYPEVNEDEGKGEFYDGYYFHILQVREMEL